MNKKKCESCGMPMNSIVDFGNGNPENNYCKHCTDKNGNLKPYEEKVIDFKNMLIKRYNYNEDHAVKTAKEMLSKFKAWENNI
jgi:hypothetical protein